MGVRNAVNRDLSEEIARIKRKIDHAVFELAEARGRMTADQSSMDDSPLKGLSQTDTATICISLELALADAIRLANRLADKVSGSHGPPLAV
jgi:hypothetical protein